MSDPDIVSIRLQHHAYNTYRKGSCSDPIDNCDTTGGFLDWLYNCENCFGGGCGTGLCSNPDPNDCPEIGGSHGKVGWESDKGSDHSLSQGREITCTYKQSDFKGPDDVCTWVNTFYTQTAPVNLKELNQAAYDLLMSNYCAEAPVNGTCIPFVTLVVGSTACPGGLTGCSRFSMQNGNGQCSDNIVCNNWLANTAFGSTGKAEPGANFCNAPGNICAQDCLCYNAIKGVDPIYDAIISSPEGPPPDSEACWYRPCQGTPWLQPVDDEKQNISCPSTYCAQVINVLENSGSTINIDIANQSINCPSGGQTGGSQPTSSYWLPTYAWILIGGFLLLLFIGILFILRGSSLATQNPPSQPIS